jgi:hypothetical protein
VSDPPAFGVPLGCVVVVLVVLLLELLQAAAAMASTKANPPRQNLRILFRPVELNLMAFTYS